MSGDPGTGSAGWWELLTIAFAAISGLFGYTMKRISDVATELKTDQVDEVHNLRSEISKMERTINDRLQEGRDDRNAMWATIREMQMQAASQHAQNLERIGKLPTRDEMMSMIERLMAGRGTGRATH